MQKQRIFGAIVVILVALGLYMFFKGDTLEDEIDRGESERIRVEDVTRELTSQLGVSVSENVERIALEDVQGETATGLATKDYADSEYKHSVLAALPDLESGTYYNGWLVRGEEGEVDYSVVNSGKLRQSKGGYLLEYSSNKDLSDYTTVWVTLETKDDDNPETRVLESEF